MNMNKNAQTEYERWLASSALTDSERQELLGIGKDDEAIALRFGAPMSFGTAGLRSTMHLGPGCMNRFTVAQATAGIAALVLRSGGASRGVAIAYDSRNNSRSFAEIAASVLLGAGIAVSLFDGVRPTPELSFAIRDTGAIAGINITASHNPKEYNGYKAYWEDGAQLAPAQADVVSSAIAEIDVLSDIPMRGLDEARESGLLRILDEAYDERYLSAVLETAIDTGAVAAVADSLKIVYTPLHGAGHRLVPEVLSRIGMKHLYTVDSQMSLDGNFPTVKKPNPEYADVFAPGIELANEVGSDLVIATDPDADRVGVMCRRADGSFMTVTGNQMGALLLDYVIAGKRARGTLSPKDYAVKSIVSTPLANAIAEKNGVCIYDVLTGFKYIGEVIYGYEKSGREGEFLMGFEESYGYLFGTYARDKDAVGATMMIAEMTAYYRARGMTLADALDGLYARYGSYREDTSDLYMEGLDGIVRRRRLMQTLRECPPAALGGIAVSRVADCLTGKESGLRGENATPLSLPNSDVIIFILASGDRVVVRPSGTEPKVKFYILVSAASGEEAEERLKAVKEDLARLAE